MTNKTVKSLEEQKAALEAKRELEQKKIDMARERKKQLEQKLKQLEKPKRTRKQDAHIKILYGIHVLTLMANDDVLKNKMLSFMNENIKNKKDRELLNFKPLEDQPIQD